MTATKTPEKVATIRHWTSYSPGERNHPNQHAEVHGLEFFACPYQPYGSVRVNGLTAWVSKGNVSFGPAAEDGRRKFVGMTVSASIHEPCLPHGNTRVIAHQCFTATETITALDQAFEWAARQLTAPAGQNVTNHG